jgi:hypothetical protein
MLIVGAFCEKNIVNFCPVLNKCFAKGVFNCAALPKKVKIKRRKKK